MPADWTSLSGKAAAIQPNQTRTRIHRARLADVPGHDEEKLFQV
jgi:hypothetical protein